MQSQSQRAVAIGTFATVLLFDVLLLPVLSSASTYDFDSPENLQVNLNAQATAVDNWLSEHPDETTEQQNFANIIRLNVFSDFGGFMNSTNTQEYEGYYKNAVSLYNDADTDFLAAKAAYAKGDYTTAGTKLSESQTELKYASATYESANSIWEGQLAGAQSVLSNICMASGDITGAALGAASGSDILDDAAEITMHSVCDTAFGNSGDIKQDTENTIAGTIEDSAVGAFIDAEAPGFDLLYSGLGQVETYLGIYKDATNPAPAVPQTAAVVANQSSNTQPAASTQTSQPQTAAPSSGTAAQPQTSASSQSNITNVVSAVILDSSDNPAVGNFDCVKAFLEDGEGNEYGQSDFTYNGDTGRLEMSPVPNGQYTLHVSDLCEPPPPPSQNSNGQEAGVWVSYTTPAITQPVQVSGSDVFLGTLTLPPVQSVDTSY